MDGLHGRDVLLWSEAEAKTLRRLRRGERVNDVDRENLIEEARPEDIVARAPVAEPALLTAGYEGMTQDAVLARLEGAGVSLLLDVRAVPQSRKPGFSKRLLGASLETRGIGYLHLRDLGTPKPGRQAARAGDAAGLARIFAAHMKTVPARAALDQAVELSRARRTCLLCFEADHRLCHRTILAGMIRARTGQSVLHL